MTCCDRNTKLRPSLPLILKGVSAELFMPIAFICLRRLGMPGAPIQSMIDDIQAMPHFIRTAFGDSSANYSADPLLAPYMGLLQGNAAAMAGCTAFVSVIVEMMKSAGFGLEMWNALAYEAIKLVCLNFVDDTQLFHGGPTNYTSGADVFAPMQPIVELLGKLPSVPPVEPWPMTKATGV